MSLIDKLKSVFKEDKTEEEIRKEKKDSINNLTENNDFMNESVNKLFDLLDD